MWKGICWVVCASTARQSSHSSLQGSSSFVDLCPFLPTAMGNSRKKAATTSKVSKSSAKKLQVKKNQSASHKYKRKPTEDEDDNLDSEESSDTLPSCKSRRKRAKHTTDDDTSVVDVDDVVSQYVSDNDETSSNAEVRDWKPFCDSES